MELDPPLSFYTYNPISTRLTEKFTIPKLLNHWPFYVSSMIIIDFHFLERD